MWVAAVLEVPAPWEQWCLFPPHHCRGKFSDRGFNFTMVLVIQLKGPQLFFFANSWLKENSGKYVIEIPSLEFAVKHPWAAGNQANVQVLYISWPFLQSLWKWAGSFGRRGGKLVSYPILVMRTLENCLG